MAKTKEWENVPENTVIPNENASVWSKEINWYSATTEALYDNIILA